MCGEQFYEHYLLRSLLGSPPRVRGTAHNIKLIWESERITPACAGNSLRRCYYAKPDKDHPRVCGEQLKCFSIQPGKAGSPPRVRGTEAAPPMC